MQKVLPPYEQREQKLTLRCYSSLYDELTSALKHQVPQYHNATFAFAIGIVNRSYLLRSSILDHVTDRRVDLLNHQLEILEGNELLVVIFE